MSRERTRRDLFRDGALGLAALGLGSRPSGASTAPDQTHPSMIGVPFDPHERIRFGIIGVGARGQGLLRDMLAIEDVEVRAICDIDVAAAERAKERVVASGAPEPELYTEGDEAFISLCERGDLDLIYIATPWDWHVPMALAGMNNGAHVGVEVPAAIDLEGCWELVECSERTRRHCVMLENVCYGHSEMVVLRMVLAGEFGELTHGEAAYIHDLRGLLFADYSEGLWRRDPHRVRDGNLYPTHGLGPIAQYMEINRGDRFKRLVSMSSPALGLEAWADRNLDSADPKRMERYVTGDMNTSLIQTERGRSIMLQHDVSSPRPYDRLNLISGTKGTFRGFPDRLFLDSEGGHAWHEDLLAEKKRLYENPLWTRVGDLARELGGHGGMDFIMSYWLVRSMKDGEVPDMDVYDAAAWSAPTPLSEASVADDAAPQDFPDFTRGRWTQKREIPSAVLSMDQLAASPAN